MLGVSQAVLLGAAGRPKSDYALTVSGIPGLLAYWRFSSTSGLIDAASGQRHGTYDGTASLVPGLPAGSDAATHMAGNVAATVPHDPGLLLPAFTLSFWVQLVETPTDSNWYFITKDGSGLFDGDFGIRFTPELDLNARFQTVQGATAPGVTFGVDLGVPYHVVVTAGTHGLAMWVDGRLAGTDDSYTGGWTGNAQPLHFAGTAFNSFLANVILDEAALYSRVLGNSEIIALSQRTDPPLAFGDSHQVLGGSTAVLDVVANDAWVGRREALVVQIVTQPGFGTVTVRSDKAIAFEADPVTSDQSDSFSYRITDPNGQSGFASVNVALQNVAPPPPPSGLAMCFVESGADTVVVGSAAALASAVNNAPPGRHILVAPGTYAGGTQTLHANGTATHPVVVRPQQGPGTVTFNDATWNITGDRLILSKLYFNNAGLEPRDGAAFTRITRCRFRDIGRVCVRLFAATDTRIDHCDFSDFRSSTSQKGCCQMRHTQIGDGSCKRVLFDCNYVHDSMPGTGANGSEPIGASSSSGGAYNSNPELIVDHCLFTNFRIPSEGEIIGAKFVGAKVRFCTFLDVPSMYFNCPRNGHDWEVRSCWFEGGRNPTLQVMSDNGLIIGNRFFGGENLALFAGTRTRTETLAQGSQGGGNYDTCRGARVIGNVLGTGQIQVGSYWNNETPTVRAQSNLLAANIRNGGAATTGNGVNLIFETGTTVQSAVPAGFDFIPAVKLTPADVGLEAPDPMCD